MLFISSVTTEPLLIEPSSCAKGLLIIPRFEGFVKILSLLLLLFSHLSAVLGVPILSIQIDSSLSRCYRLDLTPG